MDNHRRSDSESGLWQLLTLVDDAKTSFAGALKILAIANMAWLAVCVLIVATHWREISTFGIVHKIGEGVYVAGLGFVEWKWRFDLGHN